MSSNVDKFFNDEVKAIATDSKAIARRAAEKLYDDVRRQIRQNFRNPSSAFEKGLKIYEYDEASYVRLSPILSTHATRSKGRGGDRPSVWILLPDGAKLGFKRMGTRGFNWDTLRRRFGTRLSFAPVGDGHVVLFRDRSGTHPIYKIQASVTTEQRIEFFESAEAIAQEFGLSNKKINHE